MGWRSAISAATPIERSKKETEIWCCISTPWPSLPSDSSAIKYLSTWQFPPSWGHCIGPDIVESQSCKRVSSTRWLFSSVSVLVWLHFLCRSSSNRTPKLPHSRMAKHAINVPHLPEDAAVMHVHVVCPQRYPHRKPRFSTTEGMSS